MTGCRRTDQQTGRQGSGNHCTGHRRGSDLAWLWLWCRLAAAAPIRSLAWELSHAACVVLKKKENENNLRELWDNIKHANVCITGVPAKEEREKGTENLFEEIMPENLPNWQRKTEMQVPIFQNKMKPKRSYQVTLSLKCQQLKTERILKVARENN